MFCYLCGNKNSDNAKFCKYCGAKMPDVDLPADGTRVSYQTPKVSPTIPGTQNANSAQFSFEAFTNNENVKEALSSKKCTDSRLNLFFGVGHVLLVALTFLPWFKGGLVEFMPYSLINTMIEGISKGGGDAIAYAGTGLLTAGVVILVLSSAYGAYMRFAKSSTANIANITAVGGCVIAFIGSILLSTFMQNVTLSTITPLYGFFLTLIVAVVLSILGSGRVDLQKYLNKK